MRVAVAIAVAGALGALARYGLEGLIARRTSGGFPWGTFVVNVSGAFALGLVITLSSERFVVAGWLRSAITVGFLSSFTTFSALSLATYQLGANRALGLAAANMLGTCAAGLVAVYLGIMLAGR